jgi:hypothetical protein
LIFFWFAEERQALKKPGIIKKLNKTEKTEQGKPNLTPGQIGGQFIHQLLQLGMVKIRI